MRALEFISGHVIFKLQYKTIHAAPDQLTIPLNKSPLL